jgi:hypothetical protein
VGMFVQSRMGVIVSQISGSLSYIGYGVQSSVNCDGVIFLGDEADQRGEGKREAH